MYLEVILIDVSIFQNATSKVRLSFLRDKNEVGTCRSRFQDSKAKRHGASHVVKS